MREFYSVKDVALMSGLTERTIRSYLQSGILEGSKKEGIWRFSAAQVSAFFAHPTVRPSILARRNGVVFDFIANRHFTQNRICTILALPAEDCIAVSDWFQNVCNTGNFESGFQFYYEDFEGYPRVILEGTADDVLSILSQYRAAFEPGEARDEV